MAAMLMPAIRTARDMVRRGLTISSPMNEPASRPVKAKAIVVFTQSGGTAARIARFRPQLPIIAFTSSQEIRRRLALFWGVRALPVGTMDNSDQQISLVEETLLENGFRKGDVVVITMGVPLGSSGSTNLMKVHKLGEKRFLEVH